MKKFIFQSTLNISRNKIFLHETEISLHLRRKTDSML